MKCPACPQTSLTLSEKQGVEIDYCPSCRGVWLDRGELDKLIERGAAHQNVQREGRTHRSVFADLDSGHVFGSRNQRRRKSWLSDFFD